MQGSWYLKTRDAPVGSDWWAFKLGRSWPGVFPNKRIGSRPCPEPQNRQKIAQDGSWQGAALEAMPTSAFRLDV